MPNVNKQNTVVVPPPWQVLGGTNDFHWNGGSPTHAPGQGDTEVYVLRGGSPVITLGFLRRTKDGSKPHDEEWRWEESLGVWPSAFTMFVCPSDWQNYLPSGSWTSVFQASNGPYKWGGYASSTGVPQGSPWYTFSIDGQVAAWVKGDTVNGHPEPRFLYNRWFGVSTQDANVSGKVATFASSSGGPGSVHAGTLWAPPFTRPASAYKGVRPQ